MPVRVYLPENELIKEKKENIHLERSKLLLKIQVVVFIVLFLGVFVAEPMIAKRKEKTVSHVPNSTPQVQGISSVNPTVIVIPPPTSAIPTTTPVPFTPTATPTPTPLTLPLKPYTIAVVGDSMEDTMGELAEYLDHSLKRKYPNNIFSLYNYGMGSQNVEMGLARFPNAFQYQTRNYPSIKDVKPDIIIVGSYAYNPFTPYDRDRHWLGLTHLVQEAKKITPNVYMLAEIAPLRGDFGRGPQGVNWDTNTNYEHSRWIIEQLENAVGLSKTLNVPLIDVYHASLQPNGNEGKKEYVNPSDGIHPSVKGHEFTADKIVETIKFN